MISSRRLLSRRALAALATVLALVPPSVCAGEGESASVLTMKGITQRRAGNYEQSIATLRRAIDVARASGQRTEERKARDFLALTYVFAGDAAQALRMREENLAFVRRYLEKLDPGAEIDALDFLSRSHLSLGQYAQAVETLKQALALEEKRKAPAEDLTLPHLTQRLGIALFLAGDVAAAWRTLSTALAAHETAINARIGWLPSVGVYEEQVETLRWLQKVAIAENRVETALELAEKGRARAFTALLASRLGVGSEAQSEVAPLTIGQMKTIAAAERSWIVEYSVVYQYAPDLQLQFADLEQLPATDLLAWVVKPTGEVGFRRTKFEQGTKLGDLVRSARDSLGTRGRGMLMEGTGGGSAPAARQLRRLHELLIQPIADLLPAGAGARVTFVPQDLLFLVPFAALQDETGKWLVERFAIATAPSIQVLQSARAQQERLPAVATGALVVGNPTMPSLAMPGEGSAKPLPSLPGAEQEARAISALLGSPALVGPQATKQATVAQMARARVIHLATHGFLDDTGGSFSSVALAPAGSEQGFLTAREIMAMRLNAELVVLSACDTGQGKINGDGVMGLSRALIGAGASSVLVSLWAVPDAPTASLMSAFYRGLRRGADKGQALRDAMLATMKQHPSPVDWAAFTLVGEADASKALSAGIAKGLGRAVPAEGATAHYKVFPVPAGAQNYMEFPPPPISTSVPRNKESVSVVFVTRLSAPQVMTFYREGFAREGLSEVTDLTRQDAGGFTLVFARAAGGQPLQGGERVVVQGAREGEATLNISIRSE